MRHSVSRSRSLSLRAPIATEAERALFQRRLALSAFVVFVLGLGFWLIANVSIAIVAPDKLATVLVERTSQIHIVTIVFLMVIWLVARRGKPTRNLLDALDAITAFGVCLGWTLMIAREEAIGVRPESIALLACTYTLVVRAALIPSTPARTALLSAISLAPLVPVTINLYTNGIPDKAPLPPAAYVAIWAALGVAATTVISYVIYGLQLQVRKAMQLGQYLLEDKIGEGGMGVVYRASHAMLRRPTAIKLLTGSTGHAAERFEREVQITARLTHPNTVAVFDYGRTPDGVFYYAMEYLDGITLEDLVTEFGPLPSSRVVHVLTQVCGALEEAHANGLVHRDIKPANIMLTERGRVPDVVKVLDFGLVKETEQADPGVSNVNTILGTPHYMAPEAIIDPARVTACTDLYAVGATAYYLLTGEHVFDGANLVEVCSQHLHQAPVPPSAKRPDVPGSLEKVVLACLAKKPSDRPADAATLAAMLAECEVVEWTREDARAWWTSHATKVKARAQRAHSADASNVKTTGLGATVAVALDDRGAA
ncbi:MAG: serine/threonine kinase [Labilithrix sp.]|nr:serine/threonine kinase [Labilithrix sp.]